MLSGYTGQVGVPLIVEHVQPLQPHLQEVEVLQEVAVVEVLVVLAVQLMHEKKN